nr:ABC transporter substrate-binding protein [Corynebacterium lactis]
MARTHSGRIRNIVAATAAGLSLVLASCSTGAGAGGAAQASGSAEHATVTVTDNHGDQKIKSPVDKVVATDNRSFEMLDKWGVNVVAAPKPIVPFTVTGIKDNDKVVDLGNHREPNLELVAAANPDLVVNGQRFAKYYEDIKKLAPNSAIVEFEPRKGEPLDAELKRHAAGLGKALGKESEADKLIADFDKALERAKKAYNPKVKVMALNSSGGTLGYVAPSVGRTFGPLFDLIGMTPALEVAKSSDDHQGDEISVEAIAKANPDFIMVLDRDAGTSVRGTSEYRSAQSVVEEAAPLKNVKAVKEGKIYYAPEDTYTNESIITYTEILNSLADAFEQA